jgi:hypothetical protein
LYLAIEIGATRPAAGDCTEIQTVMRGSNWPDSALHHAQADPDPYAGNGAV